MSVGIHGILIYAGVVGTMRVATEAQAAVSDTTMVYLSPDREPEEVSNEPEAPRPTLVMTAPPKGFQTLDVPIDIPRDIPPIDLSDRFDPRDYSGRGVEGGVFAGVDGGNGEASQRLVFDAAAVDEPPEFLSGSPALYPQALRQAGITGHVVVEFIVDSTGSVDAESIRVLESSRHEFVEPAVHAVRGSRYRPARIRGMAVRVLVSQRIDFSLVHR